MQRRALLQGAAAGIALATWPGWLRGAFAENCERDGLRALTAAFQTARANGKPLLVFVIPSDDGEKWSRGEMFGAFLHHGSTKALATLALFEIACATVEDTTRLFPVRLDSEPLLIRVQTDRAPVEVMPFSFEMTDDAPAERFNRPKADERVETLIAKMNALVTSLAPDPAALRRAVTVSLSRLSVKERLAVDAALKQSPDSATTWRAAPVLTWMAQSSASSDARRITALLADATIARLRDKPIPGARWATGSGCGTDIDGEEPEIIGCGMGYMPAKSRRFLYFFTRRTL